MLAPLIPFTLSEPLIKDQFPLHVMSIWYAKILMKTDLGPQYQLGESFILLLSNRKLNTDGRMCRSSDRQETDNRY